MRLHDEEPMPHERPRRDRMAEPGPRQSQSRPGVHDAGSVLRLQRTAGNAGVADLLDQEEPSPVKEIVGRGGGAPLDSRTKVDMERAFGEDFGDVRIHTDTRAADSATAINAQAYTSGTDVVFGQGRYSPDTSAGKRMLAHELAHVVQQKAGPVAGSPAPGGINLSHPGDAFEQEADRVAEQVVSGSGAVDAVGPGTAPGVQRQEQEQEEQAVQGWFAQRAEEEEPESEDLGS